MEKKSLERKAGEEESRRGRKIEPYESSSLLRLASPATEARGGTRAKRRPTKGNLDLKAQTERRFKRMLHLPLAELFKEQEVQEKEHSEKGRAERVRRDRG